MRAKILGATIVALAMGATTAAHAADPDLRAMCDKWVDIIQGEKSAEQVQKMLVERPNQPVIERKMQLWSKGRDESMTEFVEPARDKGKRFLKKQKDLWSYDPTYRRKTRIPASLMFQGMLGSDFTFDDVVRASSLSQDYDPKLLGLSKEYKEKGYGDVYILELVRKKTAAVAYPKLRLWFQKDTNILLKQRYYDAEGKVVRYMILYEIKDMGGRKIPTVWKMIDETKQGHSSTIVIESVKFNGDIADDLFTDRYLTK